VALLKVARKEGVRISLGTDAHHAHQLEFIELGLAATLKAKISPDRILNFMDLASLQAWVAKLRRRRRRR
jgi:histidinol phosphatase-like PHP family hydrolase